MWAMALDSNQAAVMMEGTRAVLGTMWLHIVARPQIMRFRHFAEQPQWRCGHRSDDRRGLPSPHSAADSRIKPHGPFPWTRRAAPPASSEPLVLIDHLVNAY